MRLRAADPEDVLREELEDLRGEDERVVVAMGDAMQRGRYVEAKVSVRGMEANGFGRDEVDVNL